MGAFEDLEKMVEDKNKAARERSENLQNEKDELKELEAKYGPIEETDEIVEIPFYENKADKDLVHENVDNTQSLQSSQILGLKPLLEDLRKGNLPNTKALDNFFTVLESAKARLEKDKSKIDNLSENHEAFFESVNLFNQAVTDLNSGLNTLDGLEDIKSRFNQLYFYLSTDEGEEHIGEDFFMEDCDYTYQDDAYQEPIAVAKKDNAVPLYDYDTNEALSAVIDKLSAVIDKLDELINKLDELDKKLLKQEKVPVTTQVETPKKMAKETEGSVSMKL